MPTLAAMAGVYRSSARGGPRSARFAAYVELGRAGVPVSGYNPMTSKHALGTVEALAAIDAERLVGNAAEECLAVLDVDPGPDVELTVTVATPGMWTDRLATEVEHRLAGRASGEVLFWTGEEVFVGAVRHEAVAETVRVVVAAVDGPARSVEQAVAREGLACALAEAHAPAETRTLEPDTTVAEALAVVGTDRALGTKVAVLYGDAAATALGWTPLGIPPYAGYRHATACAHAALADRPARVLVERGWSV